MEPSPGQIRVEIPHNLKPADMSDDLWVNCVRAALHIKDFLSDNDVPPEIGLVILSIVSGFACSSVAGINNPDWSALAKRLRAAINDQTMPIAKAVHASYVKGLQ